MPILPIISISDLTIHIKINIFTNFASNFNFRFYTMYANTAVFLLTYDSLEYDGGMSVIQKGDIPT